MEHLNQETIGRLVDERPNPSEREHLASCAECATELRGMKMQSDGLGELPAMRPPKGDWEALEARLVGEGLIRVKGRNGPFFNGLSGWLSAAAALVIFFSGAGVGAAFSGGSSVEEGAIPLIGAVENVDDALTLVQRTEREYMDALLRFDQLTRGGAAMTVEQAISRVPALEALLAASQEAVRLAPSDPVFNGFLANVMAERQATLRQISVGDGSW